MREVNLQKYAPIIGDKEIAKKIHDELLSAAKEDGVQVNMAQVRLMATFCAKLIFGQLYTELGSEDFFSKVKIINVTENVKSTIYLGIKSAIEDPVRK